MAEETFETFIARERDRLSRQRSGLVEQKSKLDEQIAAIDRELAAVTAYEQVKSGKAVTAQSSQRRERRSGKRQEILDLIKNNPDGMTRGDILDHLKVKGDKSAEQSVSNALSALKRANQLGQINGKYVPA